jgi:hypothetical protein
MCLNETCSKICIGKHLSNNFPLQNTKIRRCFIASSSKEVTLEVNTEKTKYMLLSHHQNAGQNHNIKMANRSFENVTQLKHFGMTVTNQNFIQEEIN